MSKNRTGPGKSQRDGISWVKLMKMFPDDATAEAWFAKSRWGDTITCPKCGGKNILRGAKHHSLPYRCRTCRRRFSVRTGTAMQNTKLGYQVWAFAIYILNVGLTGCSSMRLHRDLSITQKSAWFLAHRIRTSWSWTCDLFEGPVEVDETYIGGKEKNKHHDKKQNAGRGPAGKTAVVGARDRKTKKVTAKVVTNTTSATLSGFVYSTTRKGAVVYTDEASAYKKLEGIIHQSVKHSTKQFVEGMAHTNGIESFWSMLKRGYYGIYFKMSAWHLQRYVNEFAGRRNLRDLDTDDQMKEIVRGLVGQRLPYRMLRMSNPKRRAGYPSN